MFISTRSTLRRALSAERRRAMPIRAAFARSLLMPYYFLRYVFDALRASAAMRAYQRAAPRVNEENKCSSAHARRASAADRPAATPSDF